MIKKMINKTKTEEKKFGDGRYVLNLPRKELYEFLKEQLPSGCIHKTFEEFNNSVEIDEYEDDSLKEVGLTYTINDGKGSFTLSLVDDFIYTKSDDKNFCDVEENEDELLLAYRRFVAKHFPEVKEIYIKSIAEKKRHYMKFYGEECKRLYDIYKENMKVSYDHYKEIFDEDCPVSKV